MRPVKYTEGKTQVYYTYDNAGRVTSEVVKEGEKILSQKSYTYEYNSTGL